MRWQIVHTAPPPIAPGDFVWIRQERWRVARVRREPAVLRLDVTNKGRRLTFLAPFDRPVSERRRERPRPARRQRIPAALAAALLDSRRWSGLDSISHARVAILPHQLEPVLAIAGGARRVLVADEVGLGKTIQAGIVAAEITARHAAARLLIVAPATLRWQWAHELRDRFSIRSLVCDAIQLAALSQAAAWNENPWRRPGVWIASLDFLKQPHVFAACIDRPWDLIVVDEAHAACGDSERYRAVHELGRRARHLLLLTATPHSGDRDRFLRLTGTGQLPAIDDPLVMVRRTRAALGLAGQRRVRWHRVALSSAESELFDLLLQYEQAVLTAADPKRREAAQLLMSVFRKRAASTSASLMITFDRRLRWIDRTGTAAESEWQQPRLALDEDADLLDADDDHALAADVGLDARHERSWLRRLRRLAEAVGSKDSKIARLHALLRRTREPVVVFTEFRHSLEAAHQSLRQVRRIAILHGGQSTGEQRSELARFLGGHASVLLATDVAGQGLNLQSRARWVLSLELPWNPARLEQRAGRVDRIGQPRPVHVTMLVAGHAIEWSLVAHLTRRTMMARQSIGADALDVALPSASAIRAAVIAGMSVPSPAVPEQPEPVMLCREFVRPGRVVARRLLHLRQLQPFWRTAEGCGPISSRIHRAPWLQPIAPRGLVVFCVPLVTADGAVIERHVVAFSPDGRPEALDADAIEILRARAACQLEARARRLQRRCRSLTSTLQTRERAIVDVLVAAASPGEVQPGLFDRQALRRAELAQREIAVLNDECRRRFQALEASHSIGVGEPRLKLLLR